MPRSRSRAGSSSRRAGHPRAGVRRRRTSHSRSPATTLQGFDVEPTTIRDFKGFSAVAFHVGTATGDDGTRYDLETDMRAFQGVYVDGTGTRRFGTFAFI